MLVENGIDINQTDYDSRTALHLAASNGQEAICEYLCNDPHTVVNAVDRLGEYKKPLKRGISYTV